MKIKTCLSIAIIIKDEEKNIKRCLDSLTFADEIVIVDCGSIDGTLEIVNQYDVRVFHKDWSGFSFQKQFAIEQCKNDWVLIIDADELVPAKTATEILNVINNSTQESYTISRKNFLFDKVIRYGSWGNDRVVRLINKKFCRMNSRLVHEKVVVRGKTGHLVNPIHHWPRRDISSFLEKANSYSTLGGLELFKSGRRVSIISSFIHSLWSFFFNFFLRGGFLDGGAGLVIAFADSVDSFFKYSKCWELQVAQKKKMSPVNNKS